MRKDRLRDDNDEVNSLDDLIEARSEETSHFPPDRDALADIEVPDEVDVDQALTFPHPKRKHSEVEGIELMDTPNSEDVEDDQEEWDENNFLPSDYSHGYDEALTTSPSDLEEDVQTDRQNVIPRVTLDEISEEPEIEIMPNKFSPEE